MGYLHCCKDRATAVKSPIDFLDSVNASAAGASDTLRSLLANPARAMDRRKVDDEQEPPTLRIYAG